MKHYLLILLSLSLFSCRKDIAHSDCPGSDCTETLYDTVINPFNHDQASSGSISLDLDNDGVLDLSIGSSRYFINGVDSVLVSYSGITRLHGGIGIIRAENSDVRYKTYLDTTYTIVDGVQTRTITVLQGCENIANSTELPNVGLTAGWVNSGNYSPEDYSWSHLIPPPNASIDQSVYLRRETRTIYTYDYDEMEDMVLETKFIYGENCSMIPKNQIVLIPFRMYGEELGSIQYGWIQLIILEQNQIRLMKSKFCRTYSEG